MPRPEIEEGAGCVVVRFKPSGDIAPCHQDLTPQQQRILAYLSEFGILGVARGAIVSHVGGAEYSIRDDLDKLRSYGLVGNDGHGRGAVWSLK